jgi:hypothetical protein
MDALNYTMEFFAQHDPTDIWRGAAGVRSFVSKARAAGKWVYGRSSNAVICGPVVAPIVSTP